MAVPAKLLYEDVSDDSVRSRAEVAASLRARCSPPPGGGCGLPIPFGIDAVRPAATRAFLGPKPAKRTHACQCCGPSPPKASARRTIARIGSRDEACGAPVSTNAGLRCGRLRPAALACDYVQDAACEAHATSGFGPLMAAPSKPCAPPEHAFSRRNRSF